MHLLLFDFGLRGMNLERPVSFLYFFIFLPTFALFIHIAEYPMVTVHLPRVNRNPLELTLKLRDLVSSHRRYDIVDFP